MALSINTVSAKLIDKTGPEAVVELTKKLGVTTPIPAQPSIAVSYTHLDVYKRQQKAIMKEQQPILENTFAII